MDNVNEKKTAKEEFSSGSEWRFLGTLINHYFTIVNAVSHATIVCAFDSQRYLLAVS